MCGRCCAQVKVKGSKGTNAFELPSAGFQRVVAVPNNENELRVTIDLQNPKRASEEDRNDKEYTQPSAMVDSSDEVVIALSHQARAKPSSSQSKTAAAARAHTYTPTPTHLHIHIPSLSQVDDELKKQGHDLSAAKLKPMTQLEVSSSSSHASKLATQAAAATLMSGGQQRRRSCQILAHHMLSKIPPFSTSSGGAYGGKRRPTSPADCSAFSTALLLIASLSEINMLSRPGALGCSRWL